MQQSVFVMTFHGHYKRIQLMASDISDNRFISSCKPILREDRTNDHPHTDRATAPGGVE